MGITAAFLPILLVTAEASASVHFSPEALARGINMDHIFAPYRGPEEPWTQEDMAGIGRALDPSEFRLAAKLGFTHVRLNIGRDFIQQREVPFSFREDGLKLLDRAIAEIHAAGLALVLDLHQVPPPDIGGDPRERRKLDALWKHLATRYRGSPAMMAFEILNEPRVGDFRQWRQTTMSVIETVRRVDKRRTIVVSGANWAAAGEIIRIGNLGFGNLIYTFHFNEPFDDSVKAGGPAGIEEQLMPLFDWAKRERIRLYCGEFGVHKPSAQPADRARWISDMVGILAKHEVGWAMWAWHSGFDLVDDGGVPDPAIVKALGLR